MVPTPACRKAEKQCPCCPLSSFCITCPPGLLTPQKLGDGAESSNPPIMLSPPGNQAPSQSSQDTTMSYCLSVNSGVVRKQLIKNSKRHSHHSRHSKGCSDSTRNQRQNQTFLFYYSTAIRQSMLKPNPLRDGIWWRRLWEVTRSWGWGPPKRD